MPTPLDRWTQELPSIGLRWWITRRGEVLTGWPTPGTERTALAMGWVARREPVGVIAAPSPPVDLGVLDSLEERFPGRRWFAGDWDDSAQPARRAA